jgi:hypothetical protein
MFFDPGRDAELRGDRTSASSVDQSCLPNRSYPPEGPCFKFRDSGQVRRYAAHDGTRRGPRRLAPSAGNARNRTSQARAIWESSLLQSEQRLRADLGACRPFFPCAHDDAQREYHASATAAGSKCIPVGSAASTVTGPVLPRRMAVNLRQRAAPPSSTGPDSKLC